MRFEQVVGRTVGDIKCYKNTIFISFSQSFAYNITSRLKCIVIVLLT